MVGVVPGAHTPTPRLSPNPGPQRAVSYSILQALAACEGWLVPLGVASAQLLETASLAQRRLGQGTPFLSIS